MILFVHTTQAGQISFYLGKSYAQTCARFFFKKSCTRFLLLFTTNQYEMKTIFITIICVLCTLHAKGQSLTLEGGVAAVPTLLPSWTIGGSLHIPIIDRFSIGASYYRWANNRDRDAIVAQYPLRDQLNPTFIFPQLTSKNQYWGDETFVVFAAYRFIEAEKLSFEAGVGWSFLESIMLIAAIGYPDAGNNFSTQQLGFRDTPVIPVAQRLSGFLQARYNLSDNLALQGKLAAYGTEHFTATVGISWMPWGDKTSLISALIPLLAPDK
jgi:hypothetical protein